MQAQIIKQFGPPESFILTELAKPTIKSGHAIVKVHATSVNPIDCKIRSGAVKDIAPALPAVLHGDMAGIIEEVADDVHEFQVGDEVYGFAGGVRGLPGALAEYMLVDTNLIALKPRSLDLPTAAALPVISITAYLSLLHRVKLQPQHHLLIHGGVGGVGHMAVQLAKIAGATICTTILNEQDEALAKSLGADEVIHAKEESVASYVKRLTKGKGFDIIFDTVGGNNLINSFQAIANNGQIVTIAARTTQDLSLLHNKGATLHVVSSLIPLLFHTDRKTYGQILTHISRAVDLGQLRPLVNPQHFTLEHMGQAHQLLESGRSRGKIVVNMPD